MGLTIHDSLSSKASSPEQARDWVTKLHSRARDLPLAEVGDVIELAGEACDFDKCHCDDPNRWLLVQASQYVSRPTHDGTHDSYSVTPTDIIAFPTLPGDGSEAANFGLCRYPSVIEIVEDEGDAPGSVRSTSRVPTGFSGWRWSSFCKTQYASNPEYGGVENFLRCHLAVIRLLDHAQHLGILNEVSDEGGFWQRRDVRVLAEEVGQWNEMIAAFAGRLKDELGEGIVSEITNFPDFEHLEAKGRDER